METIKILENDVLVKNSNSPKRALILMHGRGATADNIMTITDMIDIPEDLIALAPQSQEPFWYPYVFTEPKENNEPYLSYTLRLMSEIILYLKDNFNIQKENIVLLGFSQGACLVAEYLKENASKYAGAVIASGGLIGSAEEISPAIGMSATENFLNQTPIYIGCDIKDPHIQKERVEKTAEILNILGGNVDLNLYEELGHMVHPDAIRFLYDLITSNQ